jgi:hypothetical protein
MKDGFRRLLLNCPGLATFWAEADPEKRMCIQVQSGAMPFLPKEEAMERSSAPMGSRSFHLSFFFLLHPNNILIFSSEGSLNCLKKRCGSIGFSVTIVYAKAEWGVSQGTFLKKVSFL